MCFKTLSSQRTAKIAAKDISCFKIFLNTGKKKVILNSPIRSKIWTVGKLVKEDGLVRVFDYGSCNINAGLHSFTNYNAAKGYLRTMGFRSRGTLNIYSAIIPAGSLYWENKKQYCSDRLIANSSIPVERPKKVLPKKKK